MSIEATSVKLSNNWGDIQFNDYKYNNEKKDFQDLMVAISEHRAVIVEGEVAPLSQRMQERNKYLEELGLALADLTRLQADFKSDDEGSARRSEMTDATMATIKKVTGNTATKKEQKSWVEYYIQCMKTAIDGENNASQTDMTRLQSLVDRRDESFSTATNLMSAISDTRAGVIRNM